jgi:hypothetical protein
MPDPVTGTMAAVSIGSGIMQSRAAKDAAGIQARAAADAMDQERAMYEQSREDLAPYREQGYTALKDIERMKPFLLGRFNQPYQYSRQPTQTPTSGTAPVPLPQQPGGGMPTNYQAARSAFEQQQQADAERRIAAGELGSPSLTVTGKDQFGQDFNLAADAEAFNQFYNQNYGTPEPASNAQMMPISGPSSPFEEYLDPSMAFRQRLGTQATERLANIGGGAISGNTLRALTDYGQNLASTEYGNAFNRFQTERGNIYNTLANIAGMGQSAVNTGVNTGQNYAASTTGLITGQAAANAAGTVGSANALAGGFGGATNAYLLNQFMRPQGTPSAVTPSSTLSGYGNIPPMYTPGTGLPTTYGPSPA